MSGSVNSAQTAQATIGIEGSTLGTPLMQLLQTDAIEPGSDPSYQICKSLYLYHPLGAKMADGPIAIAQSQQREIAVPESPESLVRDRFIAEWKALDCDGIIAQVAGQARVYGICSLAAGTRGTDPREPLTPAQIATGSLYFNVLDPLNTAGSLVLNQDPNSPDFQKQTIVTAAGEPYHRSRTVVLMNERPIYIAYSSSAFGYVGRSVYQRALFPMKSFIQSMITDDMVTKKAGVIIAKLKAVSSIIDNVMQAIAGIKRSILRQATVGNVISIDTAEEIVSLNLENVDKAMITARKNVLENIAVAADMPAKMLNQETFAEGFGEGTEDAKQVARYIEKIRIWMQPLYLFFDLIVQQRAWSEEFYKTIQDQFPSQYGDMEYKTAFYQWRKSFTAIWPSLLIEPESERAKTEDVKLKAVIALLEVMMPELDPDNRAILVKWAADNIGENRILFQHPLILDYEAMKDFQVTKQEQADTMSAMGAGGGNQPEEPEEPRPFSAAA